VLVASVLLVPFAGGRAGAHDESSDGVVSRGGQHGEPDGHLLGDGEWGKIELVGQLTVSDIEPGLIADVAVGPAGDYAYLINWGRSDCAGPETGGRKKSPDAGVYVIDIRDLANPVEVGFIPTHQDTRPGEGAQVLAVDTPTFSGDILAVNLEACGKNSKAGVSLWDVSNPLKPKKLAQNFGDFTVDGRKNRPHEANETHSVFMWQYGNRVYLVAQDEHETTDVDIFDITNPKKPVLITELDLNEFGIAQPELDLTDSFLHDMVVKQIGEQVFMLASYWDGGWVILDVTDPRSPIYVADTDYAGVDQLLAEATGVELTPEGNAHQAEWTIDNRFFIGTDEDFAPFRVVVSAGGVNVNATPGADAAPLTEDTVGTAAYVGLACDAASVPSASSTGATIAVIERGICSFQQKADNVVAAGYTAGVVFNSAAGCDARVTMLVDTAIPLVFIGRTSGLSFLGAPNPYCTTLAPSIGTTVDGVSLSSAFDGWGYVRLFDAVTLEELDQFSIPEAMDPAYAVGFGDLSVHEVAVDPQDPTLAYLAYYSGGLRAVQIQCGNPSDTSTCQLVEVGGYLDREGNNFWGVETFVGADGFTYILASDRDSGLWIFRDP
jgi:hypothetical protein